MKRSKATTACVVLAVGAIVLFIAFSTMTEAFPDDRFFPGGKRPAQMEKDYYPSRVSYFDADGTEITVTRRVLMQEQPAAYRLIRKTNAHPTLERTVSKQDFIYLTELVFSSAFLSSEANCEKEEPAAAFKITGSAIHECGGANFFKFIDSNTFCTASVSHMGVSKCCHDPETCPPVMQEIQQRFKLLVAPRS